MRDHVLYYVLYPYYYYIRSILCPQCINIHFHVAFDVAI